MIRLDATSWTHSPRRPSAPPTARLKQPMRMVRPGVRPCCVHPASRWRTPPDQGCVQASTLLPQTITQEREERRVNTMPGRMDADQTPELQAAHERTRLRRRARTLTKIQASGSPRIRWTHRHPRRARTVLSTPHPLSRDEAEALKERWRAAQGSTPLVVSGALVTNLDEPHVRVVKVNVDDSVPTPFFWLRATTPLWPVTLFTNELRGKKPR